MAVSLTNPRAALKMHLKSVRQLASIHADNSQRDKDLLHRSILPTDVFQEGLPRLPIPALEKTCERYLKAQEPLLSAEDYQKTSVMTKAFMDGRGRDLHAALVALDKKNKQTSYISEPWFDMYLRDRRSVALNHNPFMAFNDDPRSEYNNQLLRATNLLMSSLKFMKTLRANVLEPEVYHLNPAVSDTLKFRQFVRFLPKSLAYYGAYWYKAYALDMSQFPRLFASTRIPTPVKDVLYTDPTAKHILVMRKGRMFVFDVLDENGDIRSASEILSNLHHILSGSMSPADHPIGILTTMERDGWTKAREVLVNQGNERTFKALDGALFNLVLDDSCTDDPIQMSRDFLHGDGCNRWFDKSFSLILNGKGKTAVNFEHSWGDGVAVLRYFNEVFNDSTKNPTLGPADLSRDATRASSVKELGFKLNDEVKQTIKDARSAFKERTSKLLLNYRVNTQLGKDYIKKSGLSPDAFMQLAIQLAHYKMFGKTAATYESCSTSAFKHGRTETIRSCTTATKQTCEMFSNSQGSAQDLMNGMKQCSDVHGQLTKDAATGQGFDRHLFAMKYYASQAGQVPDFYLDPSYNRLNHIILSTSTLTSPAVLTGGFAPVVPDGFGVGYGIDSNRLGVMVTAYKPHRSADDFAAAFMDAITDMSTVLKTTKA